MSTSSVRSSNALIPATPGIPIERLAQVAIAVAGRRSVRVVTGGPTSQVLVPRHLAQQIREAAGIAAPQAPESEPEQVAAQPASKLTYQLPSQPAEQLGRQLAEQLRSQISPAGIAAPQAPEGEPEQVAAQPASKPPAKKAPKKTASPRRTKRREEG